MNTTEDISETQLTQLGRLAIREFTSPANPREVRVLEDGKVVFRLKRDHVSGQTAPGEPVEIYLHDVSKSQELKINTFIRLLKELRRLRGLVDLENPSVDPTNVQNYMKLFSQVALLMRALAES